MAHAHTHTHTHTQQNHGRTKIYPFISKLFQIKDHEQKITSTFEGRTTDINPNMNELLLSPFL